MMGISQSNQSLSRILIPCNIYFQMPHLFATFFTFKVFAVLSALCQAGQWWGTEQRGICPGGCARPFVGELIFNTARFVGGQPTGTATCGEHWENWDCGCGLRQAGALYLPTCSVGSCGFDCRALWKIAIRGLFHTVNSDAFAGNAFSGSRLLLPPAPELSSAAGKAAAAAFSAVFLSF